MSTQRSDGVPTTSRGLLIASGVVLVLPVIAMVWVGSYARKAPELGGFPFFFWYQLMWVVLCVGTSFVAYLLLRAARAGDRR